MKQKTSRSLRAVFLAAVLLQLLAAGCASRPAPSPQALPREAGKFREPDLVELVTMDPTIKLDIRYATPNNFVGRPLYTEARAFLQRPAAEALVRAHRSLREKGYGLLIFDGYRPWSVTRLFWETVSPELREKGFVANPAKGSKHNRGAAVDLSLYDLATGREVEMPSAYDEFSERADPDYAGGRDEQRAQRDLLRAAMEAEGFTVDPGEWWHFNFKDWQEYPILDTPFREIAQRSTSAALRRCWHSVSPAAAAGERYRWLEESKRGSVV